jgi:hypothetical protein
MLTRFSALPAALLLSTVLGCQKNENSDDCAQMLSERIHVGIPQGDVEQFLNNCGFTHSIDPRTNTIYALKRGDHGGLVGQDWSAQVDLDAKQKVTSIKVEKVFTGP